MMRFFSPLPLLAILLSTCVSASAQDSASVRIGITLMRSGVDTVSVTDARDKLVKTLNRKSEKKNRFDAVALDEPEGQRAISEAQRKNCQFVLSTTLTSLDTSYEASSLDAVNLPIYHATLSYQINRVSDGSGFAVGSVSTQDSSSFRDAIWHALTQIAGKASVEILHELETPSAPALSTGTPTPEASDTAKLVNPVNAHDYCVWLPLDTQHAEALRGVCQYAIPLREKMPNFVCDQSTMRYRGDSQAPIDIMSAVVRYEDGHESYSNVKLNGRPVPGGADRTSGLRSTGEFAGNLRALFDQYNRARFEYSGEGKLGDHAAWIFKYEIVEQKDPLWLLQGPDRVLAPPYSGELWIDQKTGAVLRFRSVAKDMPPTFPMRSVDQQIDYENVEFGDATDFILPVESSLTNVYAGQPSSRNVVQFRNCHKFRATAHILLAAGAPARAGNSAPAPSPSAAALPSLASLEKDLAGNESIFAAIADLEVRDSEIQLEAEQKLMLDARTAAALGKWQPPRSPEAETQSQPSAIARNGLGTPTEGLTTLKVKVNLVLVSVVARDSRGHAVGNLSQADFRLMDDRSPQIIRSFSVEKSEARAASVAPINNPAIPGKNEGPAAPVLERDVAYVFDDLNDASDLANAKLAALRHLSQLQAGDRAAVVSTSAQVHVDFTADHDLLARAIQSLKAFPTQTSADCPLLSYYMADLMVNQRDPDANDLALADTLVCAHIGNPNSPSSFEIALAQRMAAIKAKEVLNLSYRDVQRTLQVLGDVIRRTAFLPGKRSIVLVSPGFLTVAPDMQQAVTELIDQAIRSDIVINALDIRGLHALSLGASGEATADAALRNRFDMAESTTLNGAMADLAYGTGGLLFENNNDLDEGFRRTADAPEYIYVLGFSPGKLDGKFHKLKVTLTGTEKLTLQARKGYYASKPESAQSGSSKPKSPNEPAN